MDAGGCVVELDRIKSGADRPWEQPTTIEARPWRTGPRDRIKQGYELLEVLRRGSLDARRLAGAIERTKALDALARGEQNAFRRDLARAASSLWGDRELPYQLSWALEACGVIVRHDRPLGLTG